MKSLTEREIFLEALEMSTPAVRAAYLAEACAGDVVLHGKVEALLKEHFSNDSLMAGPAVEVGRGEVECHEAPAQMLGRYKLLEKIGEGGFGEVWMAEQREPVKRRVALKIIKLGMDSRQIVARFEAERQALAMMDHPNIARILDAGTTGQESGAPGPGTEGGKSGAPLTQDSRLLPLAPGRPYFVMELVRGIKITEYCDQNQLPTRDRLDLFIKVCQAIQHAHQKGIIHRDIKPSNILVTLHDGVPVPKVIDFGIAKATQGELTDKTVFTQFQQFLGTPAYISPEQAEMSGLDIDTRADIYSLGVLLYELLVGQTPFDSKELIKGGIDGLRRIILEKEPLRPSTKLSQTLAAAAVSRRISTQGLAVPTQEEVSADADRRLRLKEQIAVVRGDLDWIVMKCLEKDRTRRYDTANGLAMDIRRHLSCEPVLARPPSQLYEFQKTVRRHKFGFAAAAAIILVLAVGITLTTWQAVRATRATKAEFQQRLAAQAAQAQAQAKQREAEMERQRAEEYALTARRNAYAADMFAAQQALESGNLGRARDLLKAHWTRPGEPDLRAFEWRFLWNLSRGDNIHAFSGHSNVVTCVAFSPDGRTLASGSADGSGKLWDVANRRLLATLPADSGGIKCLAFSNDGGTLATTSDDGLKLWSVRTHQLVFVLKERGIARIAFSPVGTVLAIGYGHPVYPDAIGLPTKLWDYVAHQVVRILPEPRSRLAFSPDGNILAARSTNDVVKLWNVKTGEELRQLGHVGDVLCLTFSPDGQSVATGNWAGEVTLWNVATGREASKLIGHGSQAWAVAFAPDGRILASTGTDQSVRLWNVMNGREEAKLIGHGGEVWAVAFSPDGRTLATGGKDEMVMLWSAAPKPAELVLTNVNLPPSFSPDSKLLATASLGGPVTVWNVATRQPVWVLNGEAFAQFPHEGGTLSTISSNHILRTWDVATQTLQRAVPLPGIADSSRQFHFALRGNRLAAADDGPTIRLHDTTTGSVIGEIKSHARGIGWRHLESMRFSPDARMLATAGADKRVKLWDVATQTELGAMSGHREWAQGLAFSPDGSLLASASYDGRVRFLRLATGKPELPLTGITAGCSGAAFAPDGRTLAVACEDGSVRLWNVATKREVAVLRHGKAPLRFVVFSSDGGTLVSVCENGTMRFWDAPGPAGL